MFTPKSVFRGILWIVVPYVMFFLLRIFSQVSSHKTSGRSVLVADLTTILINPAFWFCAAIVFLSVLWKYRLAR